MLADLLMIDCRWSTLPRKAGGHAPARSSEVKCQELDDPVEALWSLSQRDACRVAPAARVHRSKIIRNPSPVSAAGFDQLARVRQADAALRVTAEQPRDLADPGLAFEQANGCGRAPGSPGLLHEQVRVRA